MTKEQTVQGTNFMNFVGFDVLPPFIAYGVSRGTQAQREEYLRAYAERLTNWQTATSIPFPALEQYDETFQRKADA